MMDFAANLDQRVFDSLGIAGVMAYLGSYAALQIGLLKGQSYSYATLNILAASLVLISLSRDFNLAAAAIQVSWIAISGAGIVRLLVIGQQATFTEGEFVVVKALAPDLPKHRARKLVSLGQWCNASPGETLARQGEPIVSLDLMVEGNCVVERDGAEIATIGPDSLIGEMGYLTGDVASASVRTLGPVRYFSFDAAHLRAIMDRNPDIASALERSVARVLRNRLSAATDDICQLLRSVKSISTATSSVNSLEAVGKQSQEHTPTL